MYILRYRLSKDCILEVHYSRALFWVGLSGGRSGLGPGSLESLETRCRGHRGNVTSGMLSIADLQGSTISKNKNFLLCVYTVIEPVGP